MQTQACSLYSDNYDQNCKSSNFDVNSRFIIFDFDDGKKQFIGKFIRVITTRHVFAHIKRNLLEKKLIKPNDNIKIIDTKENNIVEKYVTINEIFEKNKNDVDYDSNSKFTEEQKQQQQILKLKIIVEEDYENEYKNIILKYQKICQDYCERIKNMSYDENLEYEKNEYREKANLILSKYEILHKLNYKILDDDEKHKIHQIFFNPEMTVNEIKMLIANNEFIDPYKLNLGISTTFSWNGKVMKKNKKLLEYNKMLNYDIQQNDTIELTIEQSENPGKFYQIFCKMLNGKTIAIDCHPYMSIKELKVIIYKKSGVQPNMQRIIYEGYQMEDDISVSMYRIHKDSTLHLVLRMRGGMFVDITSGNVDYQNIEKNNIDFDFDFDLNI
jgi:hypothetical protein